MKIKINHKFFVFILLLAGYFTTVAQSVLKLKEKITHQPVKDAVILINNKIVETDSKGKIIIDFPLKKYYIEIYHIGYLHFKGFIELKRGENIIYVKAKENLIDEVLVKGFKKHIERTSVVTTLKNSELQKNTSVNIGDILTQIEGVSSIKTGATIVKPVIHGMYGNRILILNNEVVQQGQDWSAEHATEINPYLVNEISVVKGAESVKYGNGALGGVVLISSKKLPYKNDKLEGNITNVLTSNGRALTTVASIEDNFYNNKIAWKVQATKHKSADLKTATYYLNNTGTNNFSFLANMGFKTEKFGIETYYSNYNSTYGLTFISEVGNTDDLKQRYQIGQPLLFFKPTYTIKAPKQQVTHHLAKVNGFWDFNTNNKLKFQYSYQLNLREEFFPRRNDLSETPAFATNLSTHNFLMNYNQKWNNHWKTEFGVNYQNQINKNVSGTGLDPTIPNFTNIGFGGYLIQKYIKNNLELTAGIRYDYKTEDIVGVRNSLRYANNRTFNNITYSFSVGYNWKQFLLISNIGVAARSPHVSELHSYGLKHGGLSFLLGDKNLQSEKGLKWVNSLTYQNEKWYVNLSGFVQKIANYIYEQPTLEQINLWGGLYNKNYFKQNDAFFKGIDISATYQFHQNLKYGFKGALVQATNLETNGFFPFIPSESFEQQINFFNPIKKSAFSEIYANFKHRFVAKQTRFDNASDLIEDTPEAYHLFGIEAGISSKIYKNNKISLQISVDNLFNNLYKEYTNRYRYFAHDLGRNIQVKTIFNF